MRPTFNPTIAPASPAFGLQTPIAPMGANPVAYNGSQFSPTEGPDQFFKKPAATTAPLQNQQLAATPSQRVIQTFQTTNSLGYPIYGYQLANGHKLIIEQRPTELVSLRTFVNAGSILENAAKPSPMYPDTGILSGLAHLDEHCHFLATRPHPNVNQWVRQVEVYGARVNASTTPEIIQHEMLFNQEDLKAMLSMHAEQLLEPLYNPQHIGQEKVNVINEMSERALLPANRVGNAVWDMMFDRPAFQTLGRPQDVKATTSDDLKRFFNIAYAPQNLTTVITGNVSPEAVVNSFDALFSKNTSRAVDVGNAGIRSALAPGQVRSQTVYDPELNYSIVSIGFPAPARKQLSQRLAMECLDVILGNRSAGSLGELLKDKTALASDINTSFTPMKQTGMFEIQVHTKPGLEKQALGTTLQKLQDYAVQGVSADELERAKGILAGRYQKAVENTALVSYVLGEEATQGDLNYYTQYLQLLQQVSSQDIQQMLQSYVSPRTYVVAFGVPGAAKKEAGNPFSETYMNSLRPNPVVATAGMNAEGSRRG